MSISKIFDKLNKYFSLSEKKRKEKENDIKEILEKLEKKQYDLKLSIKSSDSKQESCIYKIELDTVNKLIKKTKKII